MAAVRKWDEDHIKKSLKQIDPSTWLLGSSFILQRLPNPSDTATWHDKSDNSSYLLKKAPSAQSYTTSPPEDSPYISLAHEAGDASVVWTIGGDAFCKIRYIERGVTPESLWTTFRANVLASIRPKCYVTALTKTVLTCDSRDYQVELSIVLGRA